MTDGRDLAAVLWDMDGTLIDSEPIWIAQQFELAEAYGGTWTRQQALDLVGADMHATAQAMRRAGVKLDPEQLISALQHGVLDALKKRVPWRPGVLSLLQSLRRHGVPNAIVTTSSHAMAALVARSAPRRTFCLVIGAEDVARTKPSPDPYLKAARLLGASPRNCIAIEDSPNGLRAAVASGARTLAVPNDAALPAGDDWHVWPTLKGRSVADLRHLLRTS